MNLAEAAQLILTLQLKDEVSSGLRGIQGALDTTNTKGATLQGGLTKIGQGLGTGIKNTAKIGALGLAGLWTQVDAGIDSLVELEDTQLQTQAVIESTGGAAGITAEDVRTYAQELEELSGVDQAVIESGENVLLTFTNIGKDAFEPATLAALNMSTAMGTDLQGSIVQVGKALNDPIAGITALSRVGVTFTEDQKEVIKTLVETGDKAGAQKIILDELNKEFGGSAQASMEGYRGTQLRIKDTWEDLQMTLAEALLPALDRLGRVINEKLNDPAVKEGVKKLGEAIASLFNEENIQGGTDIIKEVFGFLKDLPWDSIRSGMQFAADNAKKVVDVFRSLPPGVQAGLLTFLAANKLTGGLVATGIGELLKVGLSSLKTITATSVQVIGPVTGPGGGAGGGGGKGGGAAGFLGTVGIGILAGVAVDQVMGAQRDAIKGVQLDTDAANVLVSSGYAGILAHANDPLAQTLAGILGPNFRGLLNDTGTIADNSFTAQQRLQASIGVQQQIKTQFQLGLDSAKAKIEAGNRTQAQALSALHESRDRLGDIRNSSARTANKDLSVDVRLNSTLTVDGRKIANAIAHINRTNNTGYGAGQ